jgi:hypothetical protein
MGRIQVEMTEGTRPADKRGNTHLHQTLIDSQGWTA